MRPSCFLLLWLLPFFAGAQAITYDTITVSPDDERNIYRYQEQARVDRSSSAGDIRRQDNEEKQFFSFDRSKLRFGANLGLSVSKNYTRLGFGPQAGYQFNRYFMAGVGIKYYYSKANTTAYTVKDHLLGTNLFGYFYPLSFLTIFIQPEINYIWSDLTDKSTTETTSHSGFVPSLIAGAGFRLGRSHITLNYDLIQHANSPHPDGVYLGVSAFF